MFPFQLLFCCFYCIALAILPHVWYYLILKIVSLKLPPFCFVHRAFKAKSFCFGPSSSHPHINFNLLNLPETQAWPHPHMIHDVTVVIIPSFLVWLHWLTFFLTSSLAHITYGLSYSLLCQQPHLKHQRLTKIIR